METRKVNVMGKEVQIPKDMTFGELAKEFEGEVFGKILVAKQGNSLRELICPIRTDEDWIFGIRRVCAFMKEGFPCCW